MVHMRQLEYAQIFKGQTEDNNKKFLKEKFALIVKLKLYTENELMTFKQVPFEPSFSEVKTYYFKEFKTLKEMGYDLNENVFKFYKDEENVYHFFHEMQVVDEVKNISERKYRLLDCAGEENLNIEANIIDVSVNFFKTNFASFCTECVLKLISYTQLVADPETGFARGVMKPLSLSNDFKALHHEREVTELFKVNTLESLLKAYCLINELNEEQEGLNAHKALHALKHNYSVYREKKSQKTIVLQKLWQSDIFPDLVKYFEKVLKENFVLNFESLKNDYLVKFNKNYLRDSSNFKKDALSFKNLKPEIATLSKISFEFFHLNKENYFKAFILPGPLFHLINLISNTFPGAHIEIENALTSSESEILKALIEADTLTVEEMLHVSKSV